jgi:hypothetical protein
MNLRGFEIGTSGFSLAALPARERALSSFERL